MALKIQDIKGISWKEHAWEDFLTKYWDNRPEGVNIVEYTEDDLGPLLSKYTKSGQGEIRIFHYEHEKVAAVKKRSVAKIPLSRRSWAIIPSPPKISFTEPVEGGKFNMKNNLTEGMVLGIRDTLNSKTNPGEATLLAIANHTGIISDFYDLQEQGILFTGGRQRAGIHLVIATRDVDMTKAQIEIDGGFEWPKTVVIAEMKSSFNQTDFDINQALIPMLKWAKLLENKQVHSLVLLAETKKNSLEYWAFDLVFDNSQSEVGMKIEKSKKYVLDIE